MASLDEERAFLADTTNKLDTSLEERERLAAEVAEAKAKVVVQQCGNCAAPTMYLQHLRFRFCFLKNHGHNIVAVDL